MKTIKNTYYISLIVRGLAFLLILSLVLTACKEELPEVGSQPDKTPPQAGFSFKPNEANYKELTFTNTSLSATDYVWDFGDGNTSTDKNPSHTFVVDGTYTITLTATDKLQVNNAFTTTVEIKAPVSSFKPEILNAGFDDQGDDDYRDNWRNSDLGGAIQITSSPIHEGVKAAKLPAAGDRIGYQLITVERNKEYTLSFHYTLQTSPVGSIKVAVLAGDVKDPAQIDAKTIESVTLNDQTSASTYISGSVTFNSGDNSQVAIYFTNTGAEARIDSFDIVEKQK
jgi:PKD repeat protein